MKLSDAIRLGAMLKPQAFGELFDDAGGSCALGAAEDAAGVDYADEWWTHPGMRASCPLCDYVQNGELRKLTPAHLNDDHRWTRERIADWVETIEAQHAPTHEALAEMASS